MPVIAAADIEVAFVAWARAKADPVKIMIVPWLIGSDHRDFSRWIGEVGICADSKPRDVGYAHVPHPAILAGPTDIEMAVDRVVRIERHAKNSVACALPDFEGNIEQRCRIDRSCWKVDDLDLSVLLCHKKPAGVPGRSEEHTSELQSQSNLVCRLLLEKKKRILTLL